MLLRTLLPLTAAALVAVPSAAGAATPAVKLPPTVRVTEGATARVAVKLVKPAAKRTVVRWSIDRPGDFARTRGKRVVRKGRRAATLKLVTTQDALREGDEAFLLKIGTRTLKVTVLDDDGPAAGEKIPPYPIGFSDAIGPDPVPAAPPVTQQPDGPALPTLSVPDLTRSEGSADTQKPKIVLSAPSTQPVEVHFETVDGSATGGKDFSTTSGTFTFQPGKTEIALPVSIVNDLADELDETFTLALSAPKGATISDPDGLITLTDDDPAPAFKVNDATPRLENPTTMPFSLTLDRASYQPVTVKVSTLAATAGGGATCGGTVDYVAISGATVTFAPGETSKTVDVTICEDVLAENDETLKLHAFDLSPSATVADWQGTGTIQDDSD